MNKPKRTNQIPVMLTESELKNLDILVEEMKGTRGQVIRYAIEQLKNPELDEEYNAYVKGENNENPK